MSEIRSQRDLVSIIIPTYNREQLVLETVQSCLGQTYQNIEIVVVDDGSTDSTVERLNDLASQLPHGRLTVLCQANRGPAAARNNGLGVARGTYVKFMDSDDTLEPEAVEAYVCAFNATGAELCIGSRRYMSADGSKWDVNYSPPVGLIGDALTQFFDLKLRPQQGIWCFRKSLFDEGAHWDEDLQAREDTDLLGRLLAMGCSVGGAPAAILNQRCHGNARQSGRQFEPEILKEIQAANERLYDLMLEHRCSGAAFRSFARSMSRTALRLWAYDRQTAWRCYRLAKKAHRWRELVLLPSFHSRSKRYVAYALWAAGGLRLCGPLMQAYEAARIRGR